MNKLLDDIITEHGIVRDAKYGQQTTDYLQVILGKGSRYLEQLKPYVNGVNGAGLTAYFTEDPFESDHWFAVDIKTKVGSFIPLDEKWTEVLAGVPKYVREKGDGKFSVAPWFFFSNFGGHFSKIDPKELHYTQEGGRIKAYLQNMYNEYKIKCCDSGLNSLRSSNPEFNYADSYIVQKLQEFHTNGAWEQIRPYLSRGKRRREPEGGTEIEETHPLEKKRTAGKQQVGSPEEEAVDNPEKKKDDTNLSYPLLIAAAVVGVVALSR